MIWILLAFQQCLRQLAMLGLALLVISVSVTNIFPDLLNQPSQEHGNLFVVYDFRQGIKEPNHLDYVDVASDLIPRDKLVGLNQAHLDGIVHSGAWLHVIDSQSRILLMKRGPQLVTCPNMWSFPGEHSLGRELPQKNAQRGVEEELGSHVLDHVKFFKEATPQPLYYFRDYGPANGNRVDRQITYCWWVQLDSPANEIQFQFDNEVADHAWLSIEELEEWIREEYESMKQGQVRRMCHETLVTLTEAVVQALKKQPQIMNATEIGEKQDNDLSYLAKEPRHLE